MADENEFERVYRVVKKSIGMGQKDINLPLEGAAEERKEQQDKQQGEAMRRLRDLAGGKSPIPKK